MPLESQSERFIALKKLFAKAHTANTKQAANESIASQVSIAANQIIGSSIPSNPQDAVNLSLAEVVEVSLIEDPTSNGKSYRCVFPAGYNGHFGSGPSIEGEPVGSYTFSVPFFYKNVGVELDNSGGYSPRLFDNGSEIFSTDPSDWVFDPFACLITSEDNLNLGSTGTMYLYLYIGPSVQSHIDNQDNPHNITPSQVGGISEWQPSTSYRIGNFAYYINTIYKCLVDHTSDASDFQNDENNWLALNSSYIHVQSVPSLNWQVNHGLNRHPTVSVTDLFDNQIEVEVSHATNNRLFVNVNKLQAGKVYCT